MNQFWNVEYELFDGCTHRLGSSEEVLAESLFKRCDGVRLARTCLAVCEDASYAAIQCVINHLRFS